MVKFTKNFAVSELACHDGTPVPQALYDNAKAVCERAQVLRNFLGSALLVNSGYRTPAYNAKIGGADKSWHMQAGALDLRAPGWEPGLLAEVYEGLIRIGAVLDGGLGRYDTFIHIDIGPARRWNG